MRSFFLVVVLIAACGNDDRLAPVRQCTSDAECPVGTICTSLGWTCASVQGADVDTWPAPHSSAELLQRMHMMPLAAETGIQSIDFGGSTPPLEQTLDAARVRAEVEPGHVLFLWDLAARGRGGELQLWPLPTREGPLKVPVQSLTVSFADPVKLDLQVEDLPKAKATAAVDLVLTTLIGADEANTATLTTHVAGAKLSVEFDVVDEHVHSLLLIDYAQPEGETEQWLTPKRIAIRATLVGPQVPSHWLGR